MKKLFFFFVLLGVMAPSFAQDAEKKVYEPIRVEGITLGDEMATSKTAQPGMIQKELKTPVLGFEYAGISVTSESKRVSQILLVRQFQVEEAHDRVEAALIRELTRRYGECPDKEEVSPGIFKYMWFLQGPGYRFAVELKSLGKESIGLTFGHLGLMLEGTDP